VRCIDGYLVGAKVCLDMNANGLCDAGEPSDTTRAKGAYSLSVSAADVAKYSIVVEVSTASCGSWTGINGNCNAMWTGLDSTNTPTGVLTTLAQLLQVTSPNVINIGNPNNSFSVVLTGPNKSGAVGESGTAIFHNTSTPVDNSTLYDGSTPLPIPGTWEVVSVNGQTLLILHIPPAYRNFYYDGVDGKTLFFAVESGVVRRGAWRQKNAPFTSKNFNSVAAQDVFNALDKNKVAP